MTHQEFVTKYNWRAIDYDGAYGPQCVDLFRQYLKEVLNVSQPPSVGGAKDLWNNYDPRYFDRINNGPLDIPKKGDIPIWDARAGGGHGHVAIVETANLFSFTSFDQNWPVGTYCHFQGHNYFGGLVGWLRAKAPQPVDKWIAASTIRAITDGPGSDGDKLQKIRLLIQ